MKLMSFFKKKSKQSKIRKQFASSTVFDSVIFNDSTVLEDKNIVYKNVNIENSYIGLATYINSDTYLPNCKIGRFCSIGSNVKIISPTHPTSFVSTHPSFYDSCSRTPFGTNSIHFNEFLTLDDGTYCHIGNDVWICSNVLIKGGITIGDGAVIGMGSVVTKDVPPYSIVAGNPAKIIRFRFSKETIKQLLLFQWWNKDVKWIEENKKYFGDVARFLKLIDQELNN